MHAYRVHAKHMVRDDVSNSISQLNVNILHAPQMLVETATINMPSQRSTKYEASGTNSGPCLSPSHLTSSRHAKGEAKF